MYLRYKSYAIDAGGRLQNKTAPLGDPWMRYLECEKIGCSSNSVSLKFQQMFADSNKVTSGGSYDKMKTPDQTYGAICLETLTAARRWLENESAKRGERGENILWFVGEFETDQRLNCAIHDNRGKPYIAVAFFALVISAICAVVFILVANNHRDIQPAN